MTAEKSRPGLATETAQDSDESRNDSTLAPIRPSASKRLQLSATADAWITERAHELATGELAFWQLPPSLVEFYYAAFFAGRESLAPDLAQAQRDADRYYRAAYGPKVAPEPSNYLTFAQLEQFRADIYAGAK